MKKTKKETVLSVLKDIKSSQDRIYNLILENIYKNNHTPLISFSGSKEIKLAKESSTILENLLGKDFINLEDAPSPEITEKDIHDIKINNQILIYIPEITGKEIVEICDNKSHNGELLYRIDWYKNELFYTTEKSRKGWYIVGKKLLDETRNKTWNEQEEILKRLGSGRLNFAEVLYIIYAYSKQNNEYLFSDYNYCWTSSRASVGGLVSVGDAISAGACVNGRQPGYAYSYLGAFFSCRLNY